MISIDKILRESFSKYGLFAYRARYYLLIGSVLLSVLLSLGILRIDQVRQIKSELVFAPENGANRWELKVLQEQFPLVDDKYIPGKQLFLKHWLEILVFPHNHSENVLDEVVLYSATLLNDWILDKFSIEVVDPYSNQTGQLTYRAMCLRWDWKCYENDHLILVKDHSDSWLKFKDGGFAQELVKGVIEDEVKLTWPNASSGGQPLYIGGVIASAHLIDSAGHFDRAKAIRLVYSLRQGKDIDVYSNQWIKNLTNLITTDKWSEFAGVPDGILDLALFHTDSVEDGLMEVVAAVTHSFATCLVLLAAFAVVFTAKFMPFSNWGAIRLDLCKSKPLLALANILASAMAISSALGFLMAIGVSFNDTASTMPFLILAIGVDDMFILVSAWHRTSPSKPTDERLAATLNDAAVSVTITSLTDFLSFAVGCYTELPVVWMFCAYTAAAIAFCFLYQLTFFTAVMAITGDWEANNRHCIIPCITLPLKPSTGVTGIVCSGRVEKTCEPVDDDIMHDSLVATFFREYYGPLILHPVSKCVIGLTFIAYISAAVYGCFNIQEGLDPERLVLKSHYLSKYYHLMNEAFWDEGSQAHIVVNNPPPLGDPQARDDIMQMVTAFEDTEHTMKRNATMFWMIYYERYLNSNDMMWKNTTEEVEEHVWNWLRFTQGRKMWLSDMHWVHQSDQHEKLVAYRFQVGLRHFNTPNDHRETAVLLRSIAARFPRFNVTTYHQFYPFADQYIIILPSTLRNLAIAVGCMIVVALALIPSLPCALLITAAIMSIDVGVLGFMTFWGVSLDCVSMITLIMCIGFAVDLSAHICYAYITAPQHKKTSQEKVVYALEHLGWPVLLGAVSTILGMLALISVDAYLISTFFKTVLLVIVFGLVHSLLFLPVALTLTVGICHSNTCTKRGKVANRPESAMQNDVMNTVM